MYLILTQSGSLRAFMRYDDNDNRLVMTNSFQTSRESRVSIVYHRILEACNAIPGGRSRLGVLRQSISCTGLMCLNQSPQVNQNSGSLFPTTFTNTHTSCSVQPSVIQHSIHNFTTSKPHNLQNLTISQHQPHKTRPLNRILVILVNNLKPKRLVHLDRVQHRG